MMKFENIQAGYQKPIVSCDEITFRQGEITVMLGVNGAGKSTLLQSIAGILELISGEISIDNQPITPKNVIDYVAYVDSNFSSDFTMKVRDVLTLGRYKKTNLWHKIKKEDEVVIQNWVEALKIGDLLKQSISTLSDGQRQLVMIARAMIEETPVIILDEPTAFLDIPNTIKVMELIQNLAKNQQKSIIFSTHDVAMALQLADQMILVSEGKALVKSIEEVKNSSLLSDVFKVDSNILDHKTGLFQINKFKK